MPTTTTTRTRAVVTCVALWAAYLLAMAAAFALGNSPAGWAMWAVAAAAVIGAVLSARRYDRARAGVQ